MSFEKIDAAMHSPTTRLFSRYELETACTIAVSMAKAGYDLMSCADVDNIAGLAIDFEEVNYGVDWASIDYQRTLNEFICAKRVLERMEAADGKN